jgi:rhamnogalacturonan endolyase
VLGRLVLSNGRPAAGASIFLGDNASNSSTLDQGQHYYYIATAAANGSFRIENVRAGAYALYAWPNGGITDITTQFVRNNITVQKNTRTELASSVWRTDARGKTIFQIGTFDRKTVGFKNGGAPYQHGLVEESPANLTYTVGVSKESDWYFAQSALGAWTVRFLVDDGDIKVRGSAAILSVSLAGYSKGANMRISVNSKSVRTLRASDIPSDPALYRSGTTAGEWHAFEVELACGLLKNGWNEVVFEVVATKLWKGFMWDSVLLAWKQ